jgi:hypothetical protein
MTPELGLHWAVLAFAVAALAVASWAALERGRLYAALFAALAFYGFTTLLDLPHLAHEFSERSASTAALVFAGGALVLLVTVAWLESRLPVAGDATLSAWASRFERSASSHLGWATVVIPVSVVLVAVSRDTLDVAWNEARADDGLGATAAVFLLMLGAPGVATAALTRSRARAMLLLAGALVSFVLLGSRAALLGAVAFSGWTFLARAESRRARPRILMAFAAIAFLAHVFLRFVRGIGPIALLEAIRSGRVWEFFLDSTVTQDLSGGEGAIGKALVFSVHVANAQDFGFMTSAKRVLMLFASRQLFGFEKPLDVTYRLWESGYVYGLYDGAEGFAILQDWYVTGSFGSLHPTLFGELFVSGGWTSLVASSVLYGAVSVLIDRMLRRFSDTTALLLLGPVLVGFIFVARGNSVIGFGYFFYLAAFVVPVNALLQRLAARCSAPVADEPASRPT